MVTKLFPPGFMDRETDRQISGLAISDCMDTYIHTYIRCSKCSSCPKT